MKTMRERWICPNMDVQVFTPQEFVAACESYKEITIDTFHPGCAKGYIKCTDGRVTDVHYSHSEQIRFIPPTSGTDAIREYWENAYNLVANSPDFEVYCDGDVLKGTAKVIGRGDHSITTIEVSNMSNWSTGFCGMRPSDMGNANATVVLGAGWEILKNHS